MLKPFVWSLCHSQKPPPSERHRWSGTADRALEAVHEATDASSKPGDDHRRTQAARTTLRIDRRLSARTGLQPR
jgi:hypothetical protein